MPPVSKKLIVITQTDDISLCRDWVFEDSDIDFFIRLYSDDCNEINELASFENVNVVHMKGEKWPSIKKLLTSKKINKKYDYYFFPDNDLLMTPDTIKSIYHFLCKNVIELAQPSLRHDSFFSHLITLQINGLSYRNTNFVELMCPIFSKRYLFDIMKYFDEVNMGGALDIFWSSYLIQNYNTYPKIIDECVVMHTKPVGIDYKNSKYREDVDFQKELRDFSEKYNVDTNYFPKNISAFKKSDLLDFQIYFKFLLSLIFKNKYSLMVIFKALKYLNRNSRMQIKKL